MKKTLFTLIAILGFGSVAFALPYYTSQQTMIPFVDNSYDLGTTTARWRNVYAVTASSTNLIVSGLNSANCDVKASANGTFSCGTDSTGSATFAWTPQSWGNSTSTILGFPGFISSASSTLSSLGTGGLAVNNGLIYNAATSTLSTITGTLALAKGGTGLSSITGNRLLYTDNAGTAFLEVATSSLNIGGNASTATALFANGANCGAGNSPLGVDASGAVESCFDVWTEAENTSAGYTSNTGTVTSIATTWPLGGGTITTSGTLTFGGLSTSTAAVIGNIPYFSGVNTFANVATGTVSASGGVTVTAGRSAIGGALAITCSTADTNTTGCLTDTDWDTFNNKGSGTVTSIATNNGLTGGTITTTGTLGLAALGSAGVLGAVTATVPTVQATSTLYGANGIPNSALVNSTISGIALGSNLNALTATNGSLTFSGSYDGSTARTVGLNVGNANAWTALQTFTNASSTQFSAASQTFYIDSAGRVQAKDTTLGLSGVVSPVKQLHLGVSTTTNWQGTSTVPYIASVSTTFAGTIHSSSCYTNAGRLMNDITIGATHLATTFASSTVARLNYSANNTFTAGQIISMVSGTTTADSIPKSSDCDLQITETY